MNSKEFLLAALDAEVEYKKRAYHTFHEVRSFVCDLPENHPTFVTIKMQKSIKKQAEEIVSFLWLLGQQRLNLKDSLPGN
jgi:hypothetical protein